MATKRKKVTKTPEEKLMRLKILNCQQTLSIPEAAELLRCNNKTAYTLVDMGYIKTTHYGTQMINAEELRRFKREDAINPSLLKEIKDFEDNKKLLKSKEEQTNIVAMRG